MITLRKPKDRGHANHGWLDFWHSFSFADVIEPGDAAALTGEPGIILDRADAAEVLLFDLP